MMTETEMTNFIWNIVDGTIEHVFLRFPETAETRVAVYKRLAAAFLELSLALDMA